MKKCRSKHFILDRTEKLTLKDKVKKIFSLCMAVVYRIKMNFCRITPLKKKYKVSVCAIFKNEAPYLREWIEFNHIVGIEHFYLYNNNSEDDYLSVLNPYIEKGIVTLVQWPKNQAQMECYKTCIKNYKNETQWLGFIDIDEFIVPKSVDSIYEVLEPFEKNRGSVKIYWKMFGTSGIINRDLNRFVTEDITVCWPKYYSVGKCFYNTSFDFDANFKRNSILHHMFWANYKGFNLPPVNVFGRVCLDDINSVKSDDHPIQINHYFTKSYNEYVKKCSKGDVYFKINPHNEEYFYLHEMENVEVDYSAYKYLIKLKLALQKDLFCD